jgi:hypothetical protein
VVALGGKQGIVKPEDKALVREHVRRMLLKLRARRSGERQPDLSTVQRKRENDGA